MECPMCWDLYGSERVARNLVCGHTYCQVCLESIYNQKKRIECPMCRHKHESNIRPGMLSKNFVAMELAAKHQEVKEKLQFCPNHPKYPLQFFCEDDQTHLCTECIIEHSGHKFCKQEHSVSLLKEKLVQIQSKLSTQQEALSKQTALYNSIREQLTQENTKQLQLIDDQFNNLKMKIELRRQALKEQQQTIYDQECETLQNDHILHQSLLENMQLVHAKLEDKSKELDAVKVLKDNAMINAISDLQDEAEKDIAQQKQLKTFQVKKLPKILFDQALLQSISNYGSFKKEVNNPQICFFGDKHKILIYQIEKNEWQYKQMPPNTLEYNYYAAAVSLPNGDIIISGGGVSKNVMLVSPSRGFQSQPLKNMYFPRKEHACIYHDGYIYAIGGYDGAARQMLSCCEKYNIGKDEWTLIEPLQKQKCAFAAAAVVNKHIYVFGGYDGRERLNTIERYSIKDNQWRVLDIKFKQGFSNAAAIPYDQNKILILGGGSNQGFSLDLYVFDTVENQITVVSRMTEGRDLRNKLVIFEDNLYACGGNNCTIEKYNILKRTWNQLKGYDYFISDNLDSWCSAFTFESSVSTVIKNNEKQYLNYQYHEDLSFDNNESPNALSEDLEDVENALYRQRLYQ